MLPAAVVLVMVAVRHPQALLVGFLYVGIFKGTPFVDASPVDPTLLIGVLLILVCAHRIVSRQARSIPLPFLGLLMLLGGAMTVSLLWTPVSGYGTQKVLKFWTFTMLAALAPFMLVRGRRELESFLRWLALLGVIGAGVTVVFGHVTTLNDAANANGGRIIFGDVQNTIFNSRFLCAAAFVLLLAPMLGVARRYRLIWPVVGVGLLALAAMIGSRGPLIAFAGALVVTLLALVVNNPRTLVPLLALVLVGVAVFPFISLPETSQQRLSGVARDPLGALQQDGRSALYRQAVELTRENPGKGVGVGGFYLYSAVLARQEERYPHNLFLEASAELGVPVAAVLGLSLLGIIGVFLRRTMLVGEPRDRALLFAFFGMFLFNLFAVQFSGDVNDNRSFWTALGFTWLLAFHGVPQADRT
jgi:O-antigen ligase